MKHTPVQSSMIASVGYDDATSALEVRFANGRTYTYENVPVDEYQSLMDAPSVGQHFIANIRDNFRTKRA